MFPGVDGFHWTVGHVLFLSIFFAVVLILALTVLHAALRTASEFRNHEAAELCWKSAFAELPEAERRCRHELAGRVAARICDQAFDCRHCSNYQKLSALPTHAPEQNSGVRESKDRFYHRGHTWVELDPKGVVRVGLDDLADHLIGAPDSLKMPAVGDEIDLNATAWTVRKNGHEIQVRAPIEGKVIAVGDTKTGWYLKIRPRLDPHDPATFRHLLRGPEVDGWLASELQRLQRQLGAANTPPTMADGGEMVHGLMDAIPAADWDSVLAGTFLES
jgi:glycine cleavage system H lipoate-binding protein